MPLLSERTANLKGAPIAGSFLRGLAAGGAGGGGAAIPVSVIAGTNKQANNITEWIHFSDAHNVVAGGDGNGDDLTIVDYTDKDSPVLISEPLVDNNKGGAYRGPDDMWAGSQTNGIYHLDLADLPTVTLTLARNTTQTHGMVYDPENDRLLALHNVNQVLYELDPTDPKALTVTASVGGVSNSSDDWAGLTYDPTTGYVWILNGTSVTGVDVSEPGNPKGVLSHALGHDTHYLRADQGYLYFIDPTVFPYKIEIWDATDPTSISKVATIPAETAEAYYSLLVKSGCLYIGDTGGDVTWYDVSDPSNPEKVGGPVTSSLIDIRAIDINAAGDTLFVAGSGGSQAFHLVFE